MLEIHKINGKSIVIKGIGKMFYERGFPISMGIKKLREQNISVSIYHIADECLKHGWSSETTYKKLSEDLIDSLEPFNKDELKKFCESSYEDQRDMIFNSLFENKENALEFFKTSLV